jgi:hypothetical protein
LADAALSRISSIQIPNDIREIAYRIFKKIK